MNQLKSITTELQQFMKHSVSYLNHLSPNILSSVSISFLSIFFHKIHNAYIKWKYQIDNILNTKTIWPSNNISNYNVIPEIIRKDYIENIKRETIYQYKYSLEIGNKTFYVMLWFPTYIKNENNSTILMSDAQIQNKVYRILQKIYMWLSVATSFIHKNTNCSKIVNIYLFLTEHTKNLPSNDNSNSMISVINANTAFTTGCINIETNITIYREEEWFKVFIHETMHTLGLDFSTSNNIHINQIIRETFPIQVNDIRLYETYSEIWANIMNILFVVYFTDPPANKGRLPIVRWTHIFTKRLYLEQLFSLFQATKVLHFCKLKYSDLFLPEKAYLYKEETQVFSYYILKCILLLNINLLLEFCVSQKGKGGASLKFNTTQENMEKYANILMKYAKNDVVIHSMNDMHIYFVNNLSKKNNPKKIPFLKNTLRMTLQELN
jgi:hypothetical protein